MSCIGKELVGDAAQTPIIDIVENHDIVTNSSVLQVSVHFTCPVPFKLSVYIIKEAKLAFFLGAGL